MKKLKSGLYRSGIRAREAVFRNVATTSMIDELKLLSYRESAGFVNEHLDTASLFPAGRIPLHDWLAEQVLPELPPGLCLEFGYNVGRSAKRLSPGLLSREGATPYYGFDAFEGLQDNWSQLGASVGAYSLGGAVPDPAPGCKLVVGWVEDTLDPWLESHEGSIVFCHMDMDVYPPTRYALERVLPRMSSGGIILFDELIGYPGWRNHEYRALTESLKEDDYTFIAFDNEAAVIRLI